MNPAPRKLDQDALDFLLRRVFIWVDGWNFEHDGKIYDLSAADLFQLDAIVAKGLFVKEQTA